MTDESGLSPNEADLTQVTDPEFLCERRKLRALLAHTPPHEVSPDLRVRAEQYENEFIRRARAAWQHVS